MNNVQKIPFQQSLGATAKSGAESAISMLSRSLPASVTEVKNSRVKVKFEVLSDYNLPEIEVPIAGSEYVREPIQKGDRGVLIPCGTSVSEISGEAEGAPNLDTPPNLSALIFFPIGNKKWKAINPRELTLTGLDDVLLRDDIHQLKIEDQYASWNLLVSRLNALLLTIGAGLTTPTVLTPLDAVELNPVKDRQ